MSRLNDTAALVSRGPEAGIRHTISSRKIDNGYIVEQSRCNPATGEYSCTENFTREPPRIVAPRLDGRHKVVSGDGPDALKDTVGYLSGPTDRAHGPYGI